MPAVLHASALATLGEHARARTLLRRRHTALRALDPTGPGHEILAVAALVHLWMEKGLRRRGEAARLARRDVPRARSDRRARVPARGLGEPPPAPRLGRPGGAAVGRGGRARRGRCRQLPALRDADDGGVRRRQPGGRRGMHPARRAGAGDRAAPGSDLDAGVRRAGARVPRARRRGRRDGGRPPRARARAHAALRLARPVVSVHARGPRRGVRARRAARSTRRPSPTSWQPARPRPAARGRQRRRRAAACSWRATTVSTSTSRRRWPRTRAWRSRSLARTQLCAGERLRRARRRADARTHLAGRHATFAALGAEQWAARAAHELRATGGAGRPTARC